MRAVIVTVPLFLLLAGSSPTRAVAAKPSSATPTPATATFRDLSADRITSDGLGAYVDAVKGSVCHIFTGASEDLTIGTFRSGRTIRFAYTPASDVVQRTSNPPFGSLVDNAFVNIHAIGAMPIGETKLTHASFTTAVGLFGFGGNYGSQQIVVTRQSRFTWSVSTEPYLSGAGDLSVLLKSVKNTWTPIGLYHMPFGLDVTCPTCPAPAP